MRDEIFVIGPGFLDCQKTVDRADMAQKYIHARSSIGNNFSY